MSGKSNVVSKHTNTGQVSRLSPEDEVGPSNAPAVSFYNPPCYVTDPESGKEVLDRPGSWFFVPFHPAKGVKCRWNQTPEEDLPDIPSVVGDSSTVAVPEQYHPEGRRLKTCCACGRYYHPSTVGTTSLYPHLSHVILFAGQVFREPGWYCSAFCRNLANDFVRGTSVCADAMAIGGTSRFYQDNSYQDEEPEVRNKLPVGAAGPDTKVTLHPTRKVDSWADA